MGNKDPVDGQNFSLQQGGDWWKNRWATVTGLGYDKRLRGGDLPETAERFCYVRMGRNSEHVVIVIRRVGVGGTTRGHRRDLAFFIVVGGRARWR